MDEHFAWIVTAIALYGTILNANKERKGFYYWIFSNFCFCLLNLKAGHVAQSFLFAAYLFLAVKGLVKWK